MRQHRFQILQTLLIQQLNIGGVVEKNADASVGLVLDKQGTLLYRL
jgi:hypothetical protein